MLTRFIHQVPSDESKESHKGDNKQVSLEDTSSVSGATTSSLGSSGLGSPGLGSSLKKKIDDFIGMDEGDKEDSDEEEDDPEDDARFVCKSAGVRAVGDLTKEAPKVPVDVSFFPLFSCYLFYS